MGSLVSFAWARTASSACATVRLGATATYDVVHQVAGARLGPLLDGADLLGRLGVDPLERLEELVAHRLGEDGEEVGPVVAGHLAGDVRDGLGRHALDEVFLLVVVEALEDRRGVLGRHAREDLRRLVRVELREEVGDVLGVDLGEEVPDLLRILLEDLLHVRAEEGADAHQEGLQNSVYSRLHPKGKELANGLPGAGANAVLDGRPPPRPLPVALPVATGCRGAYVSRKCAP